GLVWRQEQAARGMKQKDLSLEGLRGLASLSVVFAHFLFAFVPHLGTYMRPNVNIPVRYPIEAVFAQPCFTVFFNGNFAVSIFFVMSGYVLTKQYYDSGDKAALRAGAVKRYPRLVIPVFAATMFAYVLYAHGAMHNRMAAVIGAAGWPIDYYPDHISLGSAVFDGVYGTAFLGNLQLDGPLWTIRIEVLGSLILFAAYGVFGRRNLAATAIVFLALAVAVSAGSEYIIHYETIFAGSLLHLAARRLRAAPRASMGLMGLGLVCGAFDYSGVFAIVHHHLVLPNLPYPLFNVQAAERTLFHSLGGILLVSGLLGAGGVRKALSSRVPAFLGRISFSVYLLHWPILMSLSYWLMAVLRLGHGWSYAAALAVTAIVTFPTVIAVSTLFEWIVDRPAIKLSSRIARAVLSRETPNTHAQKPALGIRGAVGALEPSET
ncbi:MAG TPA: acyltransferase, partial [Acetobacteraceae bacterium]|nr:acyltransferase [Acetobacteraceae bacterium]